MSLGRVLEELRTALAARPLERPMAVPPAVTLTHWQCWNCGASSAPLRCCACGWTVAVAMPGRPS